MSDANVSRADTDAHVVPPGPQPSDDTSASKDDGKEASPLHGIVLILAGLSLVAVTGTAIVDTVDTFGIIDRRFENVRFAVALLGALLGGLGSNAVLKALRPTWGWRRQLPTLGVLILVVGLATYATHALRSQASEWQKGELTEEAPYARRVLLSGGNGYRYYVTLETSGSLEARLDIRGSGTPVPGVLQTDGTSILAEGVLVGDTTWTALVSHVAGEGQYLLFVDSAKPETLTMSTDPLPRAFDAGRSRTGYVFALPRSSNVYLNASSTNPQAPRPGLLLRNSEGTPMANVPIGDDGSVYTRLPAGDYVLTVLGSPDQEFNLIFNDEDPTTPDSDPPEQPSGTAIVPDVSGQPETVAVQALTDAGFVVQTVAVCSNSLAAADAAVGTTRQVVLSGAASSAEEIEVVGSDGVTTRTLPAGTALDLKSYNGLACDNG